MKIKRLIAGGLAAAAIGATLIAGGLAATTFDKGMGEFVTISSGALSSPVIVVGAGVDTTDVLGATDIAASLVSNYAVVAKTIPSAAATTGVTDGILIKSEKDYPWLNTSATFSNIKATITESDLGTLLAKGSVDTTSGTPVKYEQLINLGGHYVEYNEDPEDVDEPVLNVEFGTGTTYDLKVIFLGGLDTAYVDTTTEIKLFGKNYKFGPNPTNASLVLYSQTGSQTITIGNAAGVSDSATVRVEGVDYVIKFLGWDPANTNIATVSIEHGGNSVTKSWTESNTYTLPGSTTQVFVNRVDVVALGADAQAASVELFVGTDKLELDDGDTVVKNDETMDYTTVAFDASGTKINILTFTVAPDDDAYMVDGGTFTDPMFGSFKFALGGMTPGVTDTSRDTVKIAKSGTEKVKLTYTNDDGTKYTMDVMYYNSGWQLGDGTRALHVLEPNTTVPSDTDWIAKNEYFVLASGEKSYIVKYTGYDDDDDILSFQDAGSLTEYDASYSGSGLRDANLIIGAAQFSIKYNVTSHEIAVDLDDSNSIVSNEVGYLRTKGDGQIDLSAGGSGTEIGNITFTENALYTIGDYEPNVASLKFVVTYDASAGEVSTISVPSSLLGGQVGSEKLYHYLSYYGTYVVHDSDADSVTLYYPGNRPAYANVAIGIDPKFTTTSGTGGGTYNEAVPVTNPIAKFPSEVAQTASLDKDLILVGGPCANGLVKTLLNEAWNSTDSCAAWLADATLKDNGKGLIQVVENIFGSGKKALIVAGTSAQDTRNLIANKVIKPTEFKALGAVAQYKGAA